MTFTLNICSNFIEYCSEKSNYLSADAKKIAGLILYEISFFNYIVLQHKNVCMHIYVNNMDYNTILMHLYDSPYNIPQKE